MDKLDQKTRVLNAMDGKPVDRIPASFWHHFSGEEAVGEACVKAHLDYYRTIGADYIKIMSDGFSGPVHCEIKTVDDWKAVRPQGRNSDYIRGQVERAKRINDALQGECCTFYNVFSPFTLIREGSPSDQQTVMAHLRENRRAVMDALDAVAEDTALLAQLLVTEGGCTGIYQPLQGGELDRFTYDEYREIVMPSDLKVLNAANEVSNYNIAHLCGWAGFKNRLEIWRDYPARVFNWAVYIEGMELAEGREFLGGKTVLGGLDNRKGGALYSGTEAEIKAAVRKVIADYEAKTGSRDGLILGADCTLPADTDLQHIRWAIEAAHEA